jgi:hypothetical protein
MTDNDVFDIAALLWSNYSEALAEYMDVRRERDDGSKDWALFHNVRLESSRMAKDEAHNLLNAFKAYFKSTLDRMVGDV